MGQELTPRCPEFPFHSYRTSAFKKPSQGMARGAVDFWSRKENFLAGRIREDFPSRLSETMLPERVLAFGHLSVRLMLLVPQWVMSGRYSLFL